MIIAIDGPAGAGKSTVARLVARFLGYTYLDTGAMYRALTLKALRLACDLSDPDRLSALAAGTEINLTNPAGREHPAVSLDGVDVTDQIRTPEVNRGVPKVAAVPGVRAAMIRRQRELASSGGVVMDGRDIGTNVLPGADRKFFLTASLEERARRRKLELEQNGYEVSEEEIRAEIARRDKADQERPVDPLVRAPDAILIDTTGQSIDQVVELILFYCRPSAQK